MITSFLFPAYQGFALLLVEFLLAGGLVLALSIRLTHEADEIERLTPLSELWIGMLLLAFVTSLPEAVNSIGATLIDGALDLGVGNLTGSNMFNLMIIVVLDVVQGPGPILLMVTHSQVFVAAGGILLMAAVGGAIAHGIPSGGLPTSEGITGIAFSIAPRNCPEVNNSGWPLPGPLWEARPSFWPMNPPALWMPGWGRKLWICSSS